MRALTAFASTERRRGPAKAASLGARHPHHRAVDQLRAELERREWDALIIAVHPGQVLRLDGIGLGSEGSTA